MGECECNLCAATRAAALRLLADTRAKHPDAGEQRVRWLALEWVQENPGIPVPASTYRPLLLRRRAVYERRERRAREREQR